MTVKYFNSLEEIKQAVDKGIDVFYFNDVYQVVKDQHGNYFIVCCLNNDAIGLTHNDGKTINGNLKDFFHYCS